MTKEWLKPWEVEPDFDVFNELETGYVCIIRRNNRFNGTGHLCGYVVLPEIHPFYNKPNDELYRDLEVHGGAIHAGFLDRIKIHNKEPYCVGFDCGHAGDFIPGFTDKEDESSKEFLELDILRGIEPIYRDISYVKNECIKLAKQLKEIEKTGK